VDSKTAEILVRGKLITRKQLKKALDLQKKNGSDLVGELVRLGYTTEETIQDFFAEQFEIEKVDLEDVEIEDEVFDLIPIEILREHQVIPMRSNPKPFPPVCSVLTLAMADPTNLEVVIVIKYTTGYGIRVVVAKSSEIRRILDKRQKN